mmetsp:Transcript_2796/g.4077  ORF Transcript_2796/g.4077 Transcript_2796/m.4077 type:complete len:97 (+) Transcript_2796:193-483(+)
MCQQRSAGLLLTAFLFAGTGAALALYCRSITFFLKTFQRESGGAGTSCEVSFLVWCDAGGRPTFARPRSQLSSTCTQKHIGVQETQNKQTKITKAR